MNASAFVFSVLAQACFLGLYFNHLSKSAKSTLHLRLTKIISIVTTFVLKRWLRECHARAAQLPVRTSVDQLLSDIQALMSEMPISHFQVYIPSKKSMWKGEGVDSGVRSRFVEDELIIYRVLEGSGGFAAGLRPGEQYFKN